MTLLSRRETLRLGGSALAALSLPGCGGRRPTYAVVPITGRLIDAHCHLFNGTDLPITTFLTRLALPGHDDKICDLDQRALRSLTIEDPTLIEELIHLLVEWLLGGTLSAQQELDHLTRNHTTTKASETARVQGRTLRKLTRFLNDPAPDAGKASYARAGREVRLRGALKQEAQMVAEAQGLWPLAVRQGAQTAGRDTQTQPLTPRQEAENLLQSKDTFGALIRWVWLFFRSRQSLAQELATASRSWAREPLMLVPLVVDYAHWLGETTRRGSSFYDQIAVYGALSRRSTVPIHAMVPFDPLRSVFWTMGKHDRFPKTPEFDPLDLAEKALTDHGFLGLKFYPPMGFRATGNANSGQDYPSKALEALGISAQELGEKLDSAMLRAFDFCLRQDAPMIAHANNSIAADEDYGRRAEPRFWIEAFTERPNLRLCLGHGGGFCWKATDRGADGKSWEWSIGRYVRANPASHLYMDISYFSEVFGTPGKQAYIADQLQRWIHDCDREARHIIYGTDWIMLEQVPRFREYGTEVVAFLRDRCKLTADQIDRVMWKNAMRFLGLDSGKTRDRLLDFNGSRRPDWSLIDLPLDP